MFKTVVMRNTAIEYIQMGDMDDNVERFEFSDGSFFCFILFDRRYCYHLTNFIIKIP